MRTAHWKAHLLPLLLLSLHSVSVCLAVSCIFDELMREPGEKDIPTAAQQQTGKEWEPIRIVASTKDLEDPPKYCVKGDGSVHESGTKDDDSDCTVYFATVTAEKKNILLGILAKSIALHTDRLLVQRAVGPLKIPDFSKNELCRLFNVPAEHRTNGVAKADMVLYVASALEAVHDALPLLGVTCAKSAGGRPIAGTLTLGSENIEINRHTVRYTAHQIAHALGFSYSEMKSHNMIADKKVRDKTSLVAVVKSAKTKEMTQTHYGCSKAEGMELEDGEKNNEKFSHWERRNAKDELMATPVGATDAVFMGFYSSLTLAAFEDMGFYKANFQMAEHMEYGHNAGCDFLTGKCMNKGVTKWPNMFCADSDADARPDVCTTDRLGFGFCALRNDHDSPFPKEFQYFTSNNKKGGYGWSLTDYCPVVEQDSSFMCKSSEDQARMPGSLFSENSMCLDGNALKVNTDKGSVPVHAVCAQISCEGGSVKVKYHGDNDKWYDCSEGKTLTPSTTSKSFVSGEIKCPKYKEVCTVAPDGSSLVPKKGIDESIAPPTSASNKPTGKPNDSNSGGKSKDGSSVPFGLIPSVAFLVLSFAGYLIA